MVMLRDLGTLVVDMVLHCPKCGMQHIDAPDKMHFIPGTSKEWDNPPHRSHLCHGCGHTWRPSDVHTNGIAAVRSKGVLDSPVHDCRAGHKHHCADAHDATGRWVGSKCKHCEFVLPF